MPGPIDHEPAPPAWPPPAVDRQVVVEQYGRVTARIERDRVELSSRSPARGWLVASLVSYPVTQALILLGAVQNFPHRSWLPAIRLLLVDIPAIGIFEGLGLLLLVLVARASLRRIRSREVVTLVRGSDEWIDAYGRQRALRDVQAVVVTRLAGSYGVRLRIKGAVWSAGGLRRARRYPSWHIGRNESDALSVARLVSEFTGIAVSVGEHGR